MKRNQRKSSILFYLFMLVMTFTFLLCIFSSSCGRPKAYQQPANETGESQAIVLPEIPSFPWPPPQASATYVIPDAMIRTTPQTMLSLGDVNKKLTGSMDVCGYSHKSYYAVPGGFALVSQIEQINNDGSPKNPGRWDTEVGHMTKFSLSEYLKVLFKGRTGYFRIVVFVVTNEPFVQSDTPVDWDIASDWLHKGANSIPSSLANMDYTGDFSVTALIYEFHKPVSSEAYQKIPSSLTAREHLAKAGLFSF